MSSLTAMVLGSISLQFRWPQVEQFWWVRVERFWQAETPSPQAPSLIYCSSPIAAEFVLDLCVCAEFVSVFVLDLCHRCGLIRLWLVDQWVSWMWVDGLWPVSRWWWVVDLWVAVVCWCDCSGVIFAMVCCGVVGCLLCIREEREKDRDNNVVYDEYFILMFILFYCVES